MRRSLSVLALASLLAACGGSDEPAATTEAPAVEATPEPTAEPPKGTDYALASGASELQWIGTKNETAEVPGTFTKLSGSLTLADGDLSTAKVTVTIGFNQGIESGDAARDANIWNVFFEALDSAGPKGTVSLNSLEAENPKLAVGETTSGNAFLDVGAGLAMTGVAVPVTIAHPTEGSWTFTTKEPVVLSIDKLGMTERREKLRQVCAHDSLSNAVKINGTFAFGE